MAMDLTEIDQKRTPTPKKTKKTKQCLSTTSLVTLIADDRTSLDIQYLYQYPRLLTANNEISSIQPSLFDNIPPTIYFGLSDEKSKY